MRVPVIFALVAVLGVGSALPAAAARRFTFFGGGWGHGVGLSQYGAYGLARQGWGSGRIVRWFYRGVELRERRPPVSRFRIGLLQNRHRFTLVASRGAYELRLPGGKVVDTVAEGSGRKVIVRRGRYRVRKLNGDLVGDFGSASAPLRAVRRSGSSLIRVVQWGHRLGRGRLQWAMTSRRTAHLVAVLRAEDYLKGLAEVPSSWPAAALRAQAVAARSYAYRGAAGGIRSACSCHLYGDVRSQAYAGWEKEAALDGERWVAAVDGTRRVVAVHDGAVISAFYSSSSGGMTEHSENVWVAALPYLRGRCDPGDYTSANPNRTWSPTLDGAEVASRLGRRGRITRIRVLERGVSGRVIRARVRGRRGDGSTYTFELSGDGLRRALNLRSTRFWVNANRNVTGPIRRKYDRLRCRPGLATSNRRSVEGGSWQRFRRGRIYRHRDRGRTVWLRGAILDKYLEKRAHGGFLGLPYADLRVRRGQRVRFDGGEIYWKKAPGAHEVHGPVLRKYIKVGGPKSRLAFPTTDVRRLADGRLRSRFQHGVITCNPSTDRCRIRYA